MNHLLEIRAICKALLLWLSGANAVHYVNRKIRKKLIYRILRILRSDPVGIQTQDLQRSAAGRLQGKNHKQSIKFFDSPSVYRCLRLYRKSGLRRFCVDFGTRYYF